jgi:hypothetical protein
MSGRGSTSKALVALVCGCFVLAGGAAMSATALARAVAHPHLGKLPGYPAMRGVIPVLGSQAQVNAHERLVKEAFAQARSAPRLAPKGAPVPNESALAECANEVEFFSTQDVCYRGGPIVRGATLHLIFWQGPLNAKGEPETANVELFPAEYMTTVERYFTDVAADSGKPTNVYAVDQQYGEESGGQSVPGEYSMSFASPADVTLDTTDAFPAHGAGGCVDESQFSQGPCLLDSDIQKEAEKVAGGKVGLKDVYLVFTPGGVGGCFESASGECAYQQYCAYHSDFGGNGMARSGQTLYVDLPFVGQVTGCDSGVHPNASSDNGADAVIDDASHEVSETITDPIGSQCDENTVTKKIEGCELNAWTDVVGQEIADKCLPPESTIDGIYGDPLGGSTDSTLFNQQINGHHYWTQRVWSDLAGFFEGGCVQRMIEASFTAASGASATVPTTFDGSASGAPEDPAKYWVWDFEGEQIGTANPKTAYTFAQPGEYLVTLTAYDAYGNARATAGVVKVGAAPPPAPAPEPQVITKTVDVPTPATPTAYTAGQLAQKLGLPANKATLSGLGTISLGHAQCPPACKVSLKLYASVRTTVHGKHVVKHELIGSLTTTIAAKGSGKLALTLSATGRKLLAKSHKLSAQLVVTVTGQEGGSWQIARSLTLTGSGKAARRARR